MQYLAAAVVLVGALGVVNLLLAVAIIRRLRDHQTTLASLETAASAAGTPWLPVGSSVPEFSGATVEGEAVSHQELAGGRALVAFLQPGCAPCEELLPDVVAYAASLPGGRERALAVVVGEPGREPERSAELIDQLGRVAKVVASPHAAALVDAFAVWGFPTVYLLEGGEVRAAGPEVVRHSAVAALDGKA